MRTLYLQRMPSTRSVLKLWGEASEPNACIIGGQWPVNSSLFGMAFVLPRLGCVSSRVDHSETTMQTWRCEHTPCALGAMQPAPMLGRVRYLQASCEPAGRGGGKSLRERGKLRGLEMRAHHGHRVGSGSTVITQGLKLGSPGDRGTVSGEVARPPPRPGLGTPNPVGRPDPFGCVIVPRWLARRGWHGRTRFRDARPRLCVPLDQRVPGSRGALRESQDLLPVGDTVRRVLGGNPPTRVEGWLEPICWRVCRPVA